MLALLCVLLAFDFCVERRCDSIDFGIFCHRAVAVSESFGVTMRVSVILGLALLVLASTVSNAHDDFEEDDDFATVETDNDDDGETVVKVETKVENEVVYLVPQTPKEAYFSEHFDDSEAVMDKKWIRKVKTLFGMCVIIDVCNY